MTQIMQPQTKTRGGGLGQILQVGGLLAGGIAGAAEGPGGAVMGAAAGSGAGSTLGNLVDPPKQGSSIPQAQGTSSQSDAMARRQQQMSQDNLAVLKQAEAQLPQLPEDLRQQYAPAIVKARILEEQQRGLV